MSEADSVVTIGSGVRVVVRLELPGNFRNVTLRTLHVIVEGILLIGADATTFPDRFLELVRTGNNEVPFYPTDPTTS